VGQLPSKRSSSIIRARPRAGWIARILLCALFAAIGAPILMSSGWLVSSIEFRAGAPATATATVRAPPFLDRGADRRQPPGNAVAIARGERVKCQEQGNPERLSEDAFRYPGVRPNSRETAILAICDAVEAASRTLRNPDGQAIEGMVRRIVHGKLHLGQLDDSGLTVADLRVISSSLMETIKHAHHGRIEYPWQRAGSVRGVVTGATTMSGEVGRNASRAPAERSRSAERGSAPELASGDLGEPRGQGFALARSAGPFRRGPPPTSSAPRLTAGSVGRLDTTEPWSHAFATAATEPVAAASSWSDGGASTAPLIRPPTAAEVAAATMPEASLARSLDAAGPAEREREKPGEEAAGSGGAQRS